jgi:hypothetical protein
VAGKAERWQDPGLCRDSLTDYSDVLMNEYDERIDYMADLSRLDLDRPYPV